MHSRFSLNYDCSGSLDFRLLVQFHIPSGASDLSRESVLSSLLLFHLMRIRFEEPWTCILGGQTEDWSLVLCAPTGFDRHNHSQQRLHVQAWHGVTDGPRFLVPAWCGCFSTSLARPPRGIVEVLELLFVHKLPCVVLHLVVEQCFWQWTLHQGAEAFSEVVAILWIWFCFGVSISTFASVFPFWVYPSRISQRGAGREGERLGKIIVKWLLFIGIATYWVYLHKHI